MKKIAQAAPEPVVAQASNKKSFTPRASTKRIEDDAFEVVGDKKSARQAFSDDSEEDRVPNLLHVRVNASRDGLSQSILDALEDVPKGQNSIMKENMSAIKKLLTE